MRKMKKSFFLFYLVLISDFFLALLFTRSKRLAAYHVVHRVFERSLRPVRFIIVITRFIYCYNK